MPVIPQSSALDSFISVSRYMAWCARWKPPTPKCTMPVVTWLRSYDGTSTAPESPSSASVRVLSLVMSRLPGTGPVHVRQSISAGLNRSQPVCVEHVAADPAVLEVVHVGAADADGGHPHEHLVRPGGG